MFGIDLFDAALLPGLLVALTAGMLSFLSPCVLPIVPAYLAYMGGVSLDDMAEARAARLKAMTTALFFVLGLSTVFLFLGFTASVFGQFFLQHQVLLGRIAGAVVIVFGLHFLGVFRIPILDREARLDAGDRGGSAAGGLCAGPRLRLRLDTLHRPTAFGDPVPRGHGIKCRTRHNPSGRLRAWPWGAVPFGRGLHDPGPRADGQKIKRHMR